MFKPLVWQIQWKKTERSTKNTQKSMSYTEQQNIIYKRFNTNHFEKNR
jgi:hypothetical protein